MRTLIAVVLAACGDNAHPIDAAIARQCAATFSGNFAETSTGDGDCASLDADGVLTFSIMSSTLAAPLAIEISIGPHIGAGAYSPALVDDWSALVTSSIDSGCVYSAGRDAVPNGSFALDLDASLHGTLHIDQYLHALVLDDCGSVSTETVEVAF